jgi:hypothetical protein
VAIDYAKDADDELEGPHVRGDHVIDAGILDLDHDAVPVAQAGAVHLTERRGSDGRFVKGRKDLAHGPQLLGDPLDNITERRRRHLVLELRKLVRVLFGQDIDAGREELTDLDQYAAHLDHALPEQDGILCMKLLKPLPSEAGSGKGIPEPQELVAHEHAQEKENTLDESAPVVRRTHT